MQEIPQPAGVLLERGWQLEQGGAEPVTERIYRPKEVLQRAIFVSQATIVGYPAGSLEYETKIRRDLLRPAGQHLFGRDSIERVVHFYSGEPGGVKRQHFLWRQLRRVETALPLLVRPAAGAYQDVHDDNC